MALAEMLADTRLRTFSSLRNLPPAYVKLFEEAGGESFYFSLPWFRNLVETTGEPGQELRLCGLEGGRDGQSPLAVLVARCRGRRSTLGTARTLSSFSNMYTTLFGPILPPTPSDPGAIASQLAAAICAQRPAWDVIHVNALDRDSPVFSGFVEGFRRADMVAHPYFHFGNWYEDTSAASIQEFIQRRPSTLRNTLRRKGKKLDADGRVRFELITGASGLEDGVSAYEKVYGASWKGREPHPRFSAGLIRAAASAKCLRLGIMYMDGEPAAAQIWIVAGGGATIYKLVHDERFKQLSLGSILTIRIMEHVIEVDRVREVDFGRGDDPYKSQWLSQRRERWGIMAFNPRTLHGAIGAVRHMGGHAVKAALKRLTRTGVALLQGSAARCGNRVRVSAMR